MQAATGAPAREPLHGEQPAATGPAVELRDLRHVHRGKDGPVAALDGVSLRVAPHEVVGIAGPSGCGKSTLLEAVAGLLEPTGGEALVDGRADAAERLARCAYMPQRDLLMPWRDALDNAALALQLQGLGRTPARERARPLFGRFGLGRFERARPEELSGGMRQRVAFARTLLAGRGVLLLDEPFGGLDAIARADLQEWLLRALADDPRTVLLVTHDTEEALYLCDRVVVLSARPGRPLCELRVAAGRGERLGRPRRETVTAPAFAELREQALAALEGGAGQ